ncbi:MAG: peptidoglycan DD-metalloendopeptidase family protein [Gemmatimonadetes bacterium]|nr:peptidoglycan DD-metalloendopeptidase family protein [Gemmatimonadota bacterium]
MNWQRKNFSVLVIPDDGSRTLKFKLGHRMLLGIGSGLAFGLLMVFIGLFFFWRATHWKHTAQILEQENEHLHADVARVDELAQVVTRMQVGEQKLRSILAGHMGLPPIPDEAQYVEGYYEIATLLVQNKPRVGLEMHWIPAIWPVPPSLGWVARAFEAGDNCINGVSPTGVLIKCHSGIDIAASAGTPVQATANGQVTFADFDPELGHLVVIDHGGMYTTRYGHNRALLVKEGDYVRQGQYIALVGTSTQSREPHLHYEVIEGGRACNPHDFLPRN